MPNWTTNTLTIRGNREDVKSFLSKHITTDVEGVERFDFNTVIPQPKTREECPPKYICDPKKKHIEPYEDQEWFNWYEWNNEFWNTKWNACHNSVGEVHDMAETPGVSEVIIEFETAWDAPFPVLAKLLKDHPELQIRTDISYEGSYEFITILPDGTEIVFDEPPAGMGEEEQA